MSFKKPISQRERKKRHRHNFQSIGSENPHDRIIKKCKCGAEIGYCPEIGFTNS